MDSDATTADNVYVCVRDVDVNLDEHYLMFLPLPSETARPTQNNKIWPSQTTNTDLSTGFIRTPIFDDNYDAANQDADSYALLKTRFKSWIPMTNLCQGPHRLKAAILFHFKLCRNVH